MTNRNNNSLIWVDAPPKVPCLSEICAKKLASNHELLFDVLTSRNDEGKLVQRYKFRRNVVLSRPIGDALFKAIREHCSELESLGSTDFVAPGNECQLLSAFASISRKRAASSSDAYCKVGSEHLPSTSSSPNIVTSVCASSTSTLQFSGANGSKSTCLLEDIDLNESSLSNELLQQIFLVHGATLRTLSLIGCDNLTPDIHELLYINRCVAPKLISLNLGNSARLFYPWLRNDSPVCSTPMTSNHRKPTLSLLNMLDKQVFVKLTRLTPHNSNGSGGAAGSSGASGSTDATSGGGQRRRRSSSSLRNGEATSGGGECRQPLLLNDDEPMEVYKEPTDGEENDQSGSSSPFSDLVEPADSFRPILTLICPSLQKLLFHGQDVEQMFEELPKTVAVARVRLVSYLFTCLLQPLKDLRYLDISYWPYVGDLGFLPRKTLTSLILHDVPELYKAVDVICSIESLKCLDVSQSNHDTGLYAHPVTTLCRIVACLPQLMFLDISFTNLATKPTKGDWPALPADPIESDIYGLLGLRHKLDYLGIFECDTVVRLRKIPAYKIASDSCEADMLLAMEKFLSRPNALLAVLNEIFQIYRTNSSLDYCLALKSMLGAMALHQTNVNVQIACTASLFYIVRNVTISWATRRQMVDLLLTAMENHMSEQTLIRNCCLSFCQVEAYQELTSLYLRTFRVMLRVLNDYADQMVQRLVVHVLNSMACWGQGDQKGAVGKMNGLEIILNLIRSRLNAGVCDEVMETAWSFLWNITDETPLNCQIFLDSAGLELFERCHTTFPEKTGLMRNMMGLVGNIAEVPNLRSMLMKTEYVNIFCTLLHNMEDGIEISYNSAGVLAHMLSEDPACWTLAEPSREKAANDLIEAVKSWQLNSKRYINYRSFEPILRLLQSTTRPSQYWAVWALANLTSVDGAKYCQFVLDEGGMPKLNDLLENNCKLKTEKIIIDDDEWFFDLIRTVLKNVDQYRGIVKSLESDHL